jgi:hypothetical protein
MPSMAHEILVDLFKNRPSLAAAGELQGLLERLQTPAARNGLEAAFNATPAELGRAAVEAAPRRR